MPLVKVVLAEKPSVARELATYLKANSRRDGYFEGSGYQVTWALGHLVELQSPADYDAALQKWSVETLPFVPDDFQLKLRGDQRTRKQFNIIKRLFQASDQLICATDAGREGELIFRYILTLTGCSNKPTQRLWLSALTPQAIRAAFASMRPLAYYDNLYAAAKCRSEADWIVGLNATRNYTVRYGSEGILWSLGRVQTPVLALITRRDDEIRTFKPRRFWELLTTFRKSLFRHVGDRFAKQEDAQSTLEQAKNHNLVIQKVESKSETSLPPQLYDLTELQRDMNRRWKMPAARTLQVAQSLYEAKLITYPRTDSRYLPTDMKPEATRILRKLQAVKPQEVGKLNLNALAFTARIVNNQKVSDHHAILPTGATPGKLSAQEQKVYDAIVLRMIAAFYPPCKKEATTVDAMANKVPFRARGVRIVSLGWTELYPRKTDPLSDDAQTLPKLKLGESGPHKPFVKQGETTPPKHFTENTLLGAMDTAGKLVEDAELREALKEKGLGTPATRAAIIETLLKRQYVHRQQNNLVATDLGRYLIAIVRDHLLKSPELTGEWEAKLKQIEAGQHSPEGFMQEIVEYTRQLVGSGEDLELEKGKLGACPQCGEPVIRGKYAYGCSAWREGCSFVLEPAYKEVALDEMQIRQLLQFGAIRPPVNVGDNQRILSMTNSGDVVEIPRPQGNEQAAGNSKSRTSRPRTSERKKRGTKNSSEVLEAVGLGPCPVCGSPVVEQQKSFSCSRWSEGCRFTIWKAMSKKKLSSRTVRTLLRDGRTSVLKGFKSKAGKPFAARLKIEEGQVTFHFES